jgi:Fe-S cluster biogenesis protein NfuA
VEDQKTSPLSRERVEEVLNRVREYIAADGGYVELVNINEEEGVVFVRFQGACSG